jgi:hypothetical protein
VAYNTGSGNQLSWEVAPEPDFQYFEVYRDSEVDFAPNPGNLVHATVSTNWTDPEFDGWVVHYKIIAVDHAGNRSDPATPKTATGVVQAAPSAFALHQNVPNPFNPMTIIRYDVPHGGGMIALDVYDVTGRLVRTLVDGYETEGEKQTIWWGRDDQGTPVAAGVYFCRMSASGFVVTRKMVLLQ